MVLSAHTMTSTVDDTRTSRGEKTAGIVIIGDEILSGKFLEENARFLLAEFAHLGVTVKRVAIIPDDIEDIAATVRRFADAFDIVVTSGGVGPTHDDMTMKGIARAFDTDVMIHPTLEAVLREHWGADMPEANVRLAEVPVGAQLAYGSARNWPTVQMDNVYILPGVPSHFRNKFDAIKERFRCAPTCVERVFIDRDEGALAPHLSATGDAFPDVKIGSYPRVEETAFKVIVTLESKDRARLKRARAHLTAAIEPWIVRIERSAPA